MQRALGWDQETCILIHIEPLGCWMTLIMTHDLLCLSFLSEKQGYEADFLYGSMDKKR